MIIKFFVTGGIALKKEDCRICFRFYNGKITKFRRFCLGKRANGYNNDTAEIKNFSCATIFYVFNLKIVIFSDLTFIFAMNYFHYLFKLKLMNKTDLVNAIAEKANLTKIDAKNALDATLGAIAEALAKDDKVALVGFGTFSVTEKAARTGINPRTKEKIEIAARKVVKFKPGSDLNV